MSFELISFLETVTKKLQVTDLRRVSINTRLSIYHEALIDLEHFLEASDPALFTETSLIVLYDDIRSIIQGLRDVRSIDKGLDPILDSLRIARGAIQNAIYFRSNEPILSPRFFSQLREFKKAIYSANLYWSRMQGLSGDITTDAPPPRKK